MTTQTLTYFIALAEKGSFTEAAEACFVSQPAISRAIAGLEEEMGCRLLTRENRKRITLTPAGETLLTEARHLLRQLDAMTERVRAAGQTGIVSLSLGYIAYGMLNTFRRVKDDPLKRLTAEGYRLQPVYASAPEVRQMLASGELDCAILPDNSARTLPDYRQARICTLHRHVLVPRDHPLFEAERIAPAELRTSAFVLFDPKDLPEAFSEVMSLCTRAGFTPNVVAYGRKAGDVVDLIYQNGAVGVVTESFAYLRSEDLHLIPLDSAESVTGLTLVMGRGQGKPAAEKLWSAFLSADDS